MPINVHYTEKPEIASVVFERISTASLLARAPGLPLNKLARLLMPVSCRTPRGQT